METLENPSASIPASSKALVRQGSQNSMCRVPEADDTTPIRLDCQGKETMGRNRVGLFRRTMGQHRGVSPQPSTHRFQHHPAGAAPLFFFSAAGRRGLDQTVAFASASFRRRFTSALLKLEAPVTEMNASRPVA